MQIRYEKNNNLPPLAWLASVNNGITSVICGRNVECRDSFFVEGAWNGAFSAGNFLSSDWFCGTGGRLNDNGIVFSTPTHVTSGLFTANCWKRGGVIVSNSLHLLCAFANYHMDAQYLNYEIDFNTILFGIDQYRKTIRAFNELEDLVEIDACYYQNIEVNDQGNINIRKKDAVAPFQNFQDYYYRLCTAIHGLIDNAQDEKRTVKYEPVSTISKGYDAPCCATIVHKFGCNTAVTFCAEGKYAEDSGIDIAKGLGYSQIIEKNAAAYLERQDLCEAEQICSGELGSDLCFIAFDDEFRNKLVFTGDRGDSVWSRENPICNDNFKFDDILSHIGMSERKLWLGYISVPMPLFGASSWTSIQKISQSDEMKPWSIGNDYDRPIPRRIIEEAGISRQMFGTAKHGAGIILRYDWGRRAKERMSPAAAKSFDEFVRKHKKLHIIQLIKYFWNAKGIYLNRLGISFPDMTTKTEKSQIANATSARYLFPWASEIIQQRYKRALL